MTQRNKIISQMKEWIGFNTNNGGRNAIIDTYNTISPLPRGYKMKYTDSWCAATVSAAAHLCGFDNIIPLECGCQKMIEKAQGMGIWHEQDDYEPSPGDIILYDWQDTGEGDNTGWADHVGVVEKSVNGIITAIEGNIDIDGVRSVGRRETAVNGRYIRGFILPCYADVRGSFDCATESLLGGWAYNGMDDDPCEITITITDEEGNIVSTIKDTANEYREDLPGAGIGNGYHAFTYPYNIYEHVTQSGRYIIAMYADNEYIGTYTVQVNNTAGLSPEEYITLKGHCTEASELLQEAKEAILRGIQAISEIQAILDSTDNK